MTNEQLALLLTSYHDQLVDIFNELNTELRGVDGISIDWKDNGRESYVVLLESLGNYVDSLNSDIEALK